MLLKLLIPLCFVLHFGKTATINEFRFDATDCGDGSISNFALSVTPYPAQFVNKLPVISIGGQLTFTERAQQLVNTMSYDQFQNDFRQLISIDNSTKEIPPWITERLLNPRNNISACWSILDNACWQFYAAMAIAKQNIPAFFIVDISGTDANELLVETLLWLFRGVLPKLETQVSIKFVLKQEEVMCIQVNFESRLTEDDNNDLDPVTRALNHLEQSCATPKFINKQNNGSLDCPHNSNEWNNTFCTCLENRAGPFCQFQCDYEEMRMSENSCSDSNSYGLCGYTNIFYIINCLMEYSIPVLKKPVNAWAPDLNSVNVSWLSKNIFNFYSFTISITAKDANMEGPTYTLSDGTFFFEDIPTNYTLTQLSLIPFTNYILTLNFTTISGAKTGYAIKAGTAYFETIEITPKPPQIVNAILLSNNTVEVYWILSGVCPGLITNYNVEILCGDSASDNFAENGTLKTPLDCRYDINSTYHIDTTPNHGCIQGSSLQARVRIATSAGMSDWSDTFPVKKSGFPWLIVVAASSGAFIIAAITGSLGWLYYHKRKIEPLKDIQETLYGLEHRSYLHRQSIREPPKIDLARTLPVLPTIDKDNELYDVTPYEPSPLQSPTPRSVVNFDAIMADYYQPANGGMQSIQYVDAELRT